MVVRGGVVGSSDGGEEGMVGSSGGGEGRGGREQ